MAELENNVVAGDGIAPTDYSSTIVVQNPSNASVVSIFPLVENEPQAVQTTQSNTMPQTDNTPTSTGGSAY